MIRIPDYKRQKLVFGKSLLVQLKKSIKQKKSYKKPGIYEIGEDLLGKRGSQKDIEREFRLGDFLYNQGVSVPKLEGVVILDERPLFGSRIWPVSYLIMERIKGVDLRDLPKDTKPSVLEEISRQYKNEILKVLDLKIHPWDGEHKRNIIWGEDERIYLIDFENWGVLTLTGRDSILERLNGKIHFREDWERWRY